MSDPEKIFAKGIFFELPNDNAPVFIKGKLAVKVVDFVKFLNDHQNEGGYVNLDLKVSREEGKGYVQLNTWKPEHKQYKKEATKEIKDVPDNLHVPSSGIEYPEEEVNPEDIPF